MTSLKVTDVASFVRLQLCSRYLAFRMDKGHSDVKGIIERYRNEADPTFLETGLKAEKSLEDRLIGEGFQLREDLRSWSDWKNEVQTIPQEQKYFAKQLEIRGKLGDIELVGRLDFVILYWKNGKPQMRVIEGKATRKERTYHYIQLALYALLAEKDPPVWNGQQLPLEFVVVRLAQGSGKPEDPLRSVENTEKELLEQAKQDVSALFDPEGPVQKVVAAADPLELPYVLNARCDACPYSPVCLLTGAQKKDLELAHIYGDVAQALKKRGIANLEKLASSKEGDVQDALRETDTPVRADILITKAKARLATLEGATRQGEKRYPVMWVKAGYGHLPEHEVEGKPLIRVYLVVERDLLEDRLNALTAHLALGTEKLQVQEGGGISLRQAGDDATDAFDVEVNDVPKGRVEMVVRTQPWSGDPGSDDPQEAEMIERFLKKVALAIKEIGDRNNCDSLPLHFYVWSTQEVQDLVTGILRAGKKAGSLVEAFEHLLGCRESLEQLIFSSLQDELQNRYCFGFTSQSLIAVTSLPWLIHDEKDEDGASVDVPRKKRLCDFPWNSVNGKDLRKHFEPWHFDFMESGKREVREVRSRNYDTLPAVYWRAFWDAMPQTEKEGLRTQLDKVKKGAKHLREYLAARTLALRWLEERVKYKNKLIKKPALDLSKLPEFHIEDRDIVQVAVDFLRFEQHVRRHYWLADKTLPPGIRVQNGTALILQDVKPSNDEEMTASTGPANADLRSTSVKPSNDKEILTASIKPYPENSDLTALRDRFTLREEDYVRVSEIKSENHPQKFSALLYKGVTAELVELDWDKGKVKLEVRASRPTGEDCRYILPSQCPKGGWELAVLDPSVSDYVARRVDHILTNASDHPVLTCFDIENPLLPLHDGHNLEMAKVQRFLDEYEATTGRVLHDSQKKAILDGLQYRVHLLQGPPGTGKTDVTAVALLLWAQLFEGPMVVAASTHNAIDTLRERVEKVKQSVKSASEAAQLGWKRVSLINLDPGKEGRGGEAREEEGGGGEVCIFFGTTNNVLTELTKNQKTPRLLVVDEASMMPFPHFLALITLLPRDKEVNWKIMLVGDDRQLSPILQHYWEEEKRPGVQRYLPYLSAFEAIRLIHERLQGSSGVGRSGLECTYRLPPEVIKIIEPLYEKDGIRLKSNKQLTKANFEDGVSVWDGVWAGSGGVYLLLHNEQGSYKRNELEVQIIRNVLGAPSKPNDLKADDVAVVTPFRAHRALLRERLGDKVGSVDTVERLQGGERRVVFYSACASDPAGLMELQDFLLNVNRTNVAFSRAKERLVVVASETLLNYIPSSVEAYKEAVLWKTLRKSCTRQVAEAEETVNGNRYRVRLLVPHTSG